jgi:DNA-binding LacI/PurR family transcriptional regulator/signal transduction histidine kinase
MIGVFAAQFEAYQTAVWRGIESRASERGIGVVYFFGHRIDSPVPEEATSNFVYGIADRKNVDGLIVMTTAIATFLDARGVSGIFSSRKELPQVSVGLMTPGIPSVTVDGTDGVASVIRHMIRDHGITRFALVGGPPGHPEAEERYRAFRRTLEEEGVKFDDRLAVSGSFLRESGEESARRLLDMGTPFKALFCLNDRMALGAMDVLREAGIRVPGDVAVVGFDGIEEAKYATPPLTTVIQPLEELGSSALDLLMERMDGGAPSNRVLTCKAIFRQSCGCLPTRGYDAELEKIPARATAEERVTISDLTERAARSDSEGFINRLNAALALTTLNGGAPGRWNDYLSVIRHRLNHTETPAPLFEFARVLVGEAESRRQAARRVATEERLAMLRAINASLAGAFELPTMLDRLQAGLSQLGINAGFLVLFDGESTGTGVGRLVMARRDGKPLDLPADGALFKTERILPALVDPSWKRGQWVLEPLVFQNEPLGYLLLPGGAAEPAVYDTLRLQLASALKGTLLLDQVRSHEHRLEEEVARRTAELTRINSELTGEIERRKLLEREVLEISNRTMQRIGQDLHDDLCQHLAGIAMLTRVLRGGVSAGDSAAVDSIDQISGLLADSIFRAKQIARGLYPAGLEEHGLAAAVEELVESARRNYAIAIEFRASPDFFLPDTDRALQVYRIVQEALTNALKHAGSDRIEVRLYRDADHRVLIAAVTDNGGGMPETVPGGGMGLRIMRYRAETTGAELCIERLDPGTRISCRIPSAWGEH